MNAGKKILSFFPFFQKAKTRKKVLILEGGGMRGVFLAGILQSFADRGFFPWECIIGSSAGALIGTAYAAGQIHIARDALFTKLLTGNFIHFSNIIRQGRHILDLDWMVDTIIKGEDPLDENKLKKSCPVIITATHCGKYLPPETIYLNSKKDDIAVSLKATAAIPFLYRGFVKYGDYRLLDGALIDPIPYKKALQMGYKQDEIVVVVTRNKGYRKKEESFWIRALLEKYFDKPEYRQLVELLNERYKLYNSIKDELESTYNKISVIYPPVNYSVDRLTQDPKKILEGFEMGIEQGIMFLKNQ